MRASAPDLPRRRLRFLRARQRSAALADLLADLARLDTAPPEPAAGIDPAERALLIELYRELVGTVEGPVAPFPVELMEDPDQVAERPEPAVLLDLEAFRARRRPAED